MSISNTTRKIYRTVTASRALVEKCIAWAVHLHAKALQKDVAKANADCVKAYKHVQFIDSVAVRAGVKYYEVAALSEDVERNVAIELKRIGFKA